MSDSNKVYLADIKVQTNCNVFRGKVKLTPEYITIKDFIIGSTDLKILNETHLSRIYRELDYSPEKRKVAIAESRIKIISVENVSKPLGLVNEEN